MAQKFCKLRVCLVALTPFRSARELAGRQQKATSSSDSHPNRAGSIHPIPRKTRSGKNLLPWIPSYPLARRRMSPPAGHTSLPICSPGRRTSTPTHPPCYLAGARLEVHLRPQELDLHPTEVLEPLWSATKQVIFGSGVFGTGVPGSEYLSGVESFLSAAKHALTFYFLMFPNPTQLAVFQPRGVLPNQPKHKDIQ